MNQVNLIGRLVRDPELRFISNTGTAVCNFTLAVDKNLSREKKQQFESQGKPTADFIRIQAWGKQGEAAANYLVKGRQVAIQGSIQTGSYEKNGVRHYTTDILANRVEFLEWGDQGGQSAGNGYDQAQMDVQDYSDVGNEDDIPF
jgi:single-strand DNA-binding protein